MSNDKEVTSAGKEPRPESGQQLFEKLVAVGDSHAKVVLPMRSEREIRELLDKMRAGTRLDNASPRETPERGRRIQAIKEVFTLERAKNLCKACFGDTDVDGVMMLHAMTERTLACFTRFLLAVRDDEKTAAATAINDLLGTEEGNGAIEILSAVLALYGDYLPHGDPVRVLFNKHDVDPLRAPTVCHAVLKLATLVEEGTREAIRLQMKLGVRESKDLSVPALTAHAMTLWPWVRDWFHNIELNYVDLHLLLEKEFAAARQAARQSLSVAGKPAAPQAPAVIATGAAAEEDEPEAGAGGDVAIEGVATEHQQDEPKARGVRWQDAAQRMERRRMQGDRFPGQRKMAREIGCVPATISKAIQKTPSLQEWAKPQSPSPRSQSINDVVTDSTPQITEADPADDAAIREHLERDLSPDERAFFNGISRQDQIDFLDDPGKHDRILGRKP